MSQIELTDQETTKIAREMTPNPNCRTLLNADLGFANSFVCEGRLTFSNGKVHIEGACDEPCEFVCKTSREFANVVGLIQKVIRTINLVRP